MIAITGYQGGGMIIEIALGIILALFILTCWPLILAGGLVLVVGGVVIAIVVALGVIAYENPSDAIGWGVAILSLVAYGWLALWVNRRTSIAMESVIVMEICATVAAFGLYGLAVILTGDDPIRLIPVSVIVFCVALMIAAGYLTLRRALQNRAPQQVST